MKKILTVFCAFFICLMLFLATVAFPFCACAETSELIDESTGIRVSGNFTVDARLNTAIITDGVKYRQAKIALNEISDKFLLYKVGLETPLTGLETFTIFLPLTNGIDPEDCEIYRITNTTATKLIASRYETYVSFNGNDFGTFAVTYSKITVNEGERGLDSLEIAFICIGSVLGAVLIGFAVFFIIKSKKH